MSETVIKAIVIIVLFTAAFAVSAVVTYKTRKKHFTSKDNNTDTLHEQE